MGHARGVICLAAARSHVPVSSYTSTQIKLSLTGNGRAGKEQVQRAIHMRLKLKRIPSSPDVADALAAALCHCSVVSSPIIAAANAPALEKLNKRRTTGKPTFRDGQFQKGATKTR